MGKSKNQANRTVLSMSIVGLSVLGIVAMVILISSIATDLIFNLNDLMVVTDNGCYLAGLFLIFFKIYKFHSHHKQIRALTKTIYKPIQNLWQSDDPGILNLLKTNTLYENIGFAFFTSMGGILMIALIFFVPTGDGELPIHGAYPFDITISPIHQLAFVSQMFAVAYGVTAILLMDTIGLGFMRWINVQLIVLTSNYRNCTPRRSEVNKNQEPTEIFNFAAFFENEFDSVENTFTMRYKNCVTNHQRIIKIIDEMNTTFSGSMLMQLFSSFSMICLTGFQAVLGTRGTSNLMKFVIYLGAALTQLLYWCYYGNELLYKKHSLMSAQWMSGWENHLNSTSKILMIMSTIRTMQPFELRAGVFFTLSMDTFISVVKSSYSFFALLTTVTSD